MKHWSSAHLRLVASFAFAAVVLPSSIHAMEGGLTPSLRGYRDFQSGIVPAPGVYWRQDTYFYTGTEGSIVPQGQLRIHLNAAASILGATVVTPYRIFGGQYAFAVRGAISELSAAQSIALNRPKVTLTRTGKLGALNDVVVSPLILGWHSGYLHWNVAAAVWLPAGAYDKDRLVNAGRNYWSVSPQFAVTYFNPRSGWEFSAASMYVTSYENTATNYQSGNFVQIDFSGAKNLSPQFKIGVVGYYVQQLTADSGLGAILGERRLRIAGIGPGMTFSFAVNNVPVSLVAKYYREFDAQNTVEGSAGTLSIRARF